MYLFGTLDPHPPTATPILGHSPKKDGFLFSLKSLELWTPTLLFAFYFLFHPLSVLFAFFFAELG